LHVHIAPKTQNSNTDFIRIHNIVIFELHAILQRIRCILNKVEFMPHSHNTSQPAVTLSIRVPSKARDQLEDLANSTGRTKSFLAAEAIEYYLETQAWQVKAIEKSVKKANSKKAKFIGHQNVSDWLNSWGSDKEQERYFMLQCNGRKNFNIRRL